MSGVTGSGRRECEKCGGWGFSDPDALMETPPCPVCGGSGWVDCDGVAVAAPPFADELIERMMADLARMLAVPRVMLDTRWDEGMDRATVLHVLRGLRELPPGGRAPGEGRPTSHRSERTVADASVRAVHADSADDRESSRTMSGEGRMRPRVIEARVRRVRWRRWVGYVVEHGDASEGPVVHRVGMYRSRVRASEASRKMASEMSARRGHSGRGPLWPGEHVAVFPGAVSWHVDEGGHPDLLALMAEAMANDTTREGDR